MSELISRIYRCIEAQKLAEFGLIRFKEHREIRLMLARNGSGWGLGAFGRVSREVTETRLFFMLHLESLWEVKTVGLDFKAPFHSLVCVYGYKTLLSYLADIIHKYLKLLWADKSLGHIDDRDLVVT